MVFMMTYEYDGYTTWCAIPGKKYGYMMVIYYMVMIMDALELWNDMDSVQLLL